MIKEFSARLAKGDNKGAWTCVVMHDVEELFELKRRSFLRQGCNQLFSHQIGKTARERTFSLHKHERLA